MLVNRRTLRIEWGDCDPQGIVFYPHYFSWFDAGTHALLERTGLSARDLWSKYGAEGIPVLDTRAQFIIPLRYGDELVAESQIGKWGRSSFTVLHRLFKHGVLAAEGFEKRVWVVPHPSEPGRLTGHPVPDEVIACLSDPTGATRCGP